MKKLKNEKELLKEAIRVGMIYAEKRGVAEFEATDSQHLKIEYLYRLLVHEKQLQPLAKGQIDALRPDSAPCKPLPDSMLC